MLRRFPTSDQQLKKFLAQHREVEGALVQIDVCLEKEFEKRLELWEQLSAELLTEEPAAYERVKRLLSDLRDAL